LEQNYGKIERQEKPMIYLGTNNESQDAKDYPVPHHRTDHIVMLSNIESDVRKNRSGYAATVVQTVSKQMAKAVSAIRRDINSTKRHDRRGS
jgi:hypothetical protein